MQSYGKGLFSLTLNESKKTLKKHGEFRFTNCQKINKYGPFHPIVVNFKQFTVNLSLTQA